jgi:hypothetical protein
MFRLQSVGVMSVARTMAVIQGSISLIFVPFMVIAALAGAFAGQGAEKLSSLLFVGLAVLLPLVYAGMGFVMGAVMAVIYNLVAGKFGGIEMHFAPAPLVPGTGLPQTYEPRPS